MKDGMKLLGGCSLNGQYSGICEGTSFMGPMPNPSLVMMMMMKNKNNYK